MRVLAVCAANTFLSPLFAAILSRELGEFGTEVEIESAALVKAAGEGRPTPDEGIIAASEIGIDLRHHRTRWFGSLRPGYDIIFCMDGWWAARLSAGGIPREAIRIANAPKGVPNPWGRDLYHYRTAAKLLEGAAAAAAHSIRLGVWTTQRGNRPNR